MPRILSSIVTALLTATAIVARPLPAVNIDARSVRDVEDRWVDALRRRDVAALSAILDDRFLDVTYTGRVHDRKASIAALTVPDRPHMDQRLEDLEIRFPASNVAVVTGVNVVTAHEPAFTARVRFTDIFVKAEGSWKAFSAQETLEK
jgi:ketosteroid isomerase-like protein